MLAPLKTYAIALVAVAAALALRWLLDPVLGDTLPFVTIFGAVALAVWVGGARPAILATVLGYVGCHYLFIPPRGAIEIASLADLVGLLAYLFTSTIIVLLGQAARGAQHRAQERGETLRVTLQSIGDAVITTDLDARITSMNPVAASLTGWPIPDAIGQHLDAVFRIVSEDTRQAVANPAARALREGAIVGLANHTLLIDKAGGERPIDDSAAPIRDEHGEVAGCVVIFRDVTQQRRRQRETIEQLIAARTLAAIVESSNDAIVGKSLDGVIQSWNAAAERLFGYSASEAIGRHIGLIIPEERLAEEDQIIASIRAGRRIEHFETERVHRDGRRVPVSLTISPIKDQSGAVVGASKTARDITAHKAAEAERKRLADDLREADRRKNEFLATLAHELRNPLAPLSNMVEVMKRTENPETLRQARLTIERQVGQLIRLVDDLLDLNRITHNRLDLRRSEVELATIIHHALEASRPLAEAARHRVHVSLPPTPIRLIADPARLAQVFSNLLNNACKYMAPNGAIWVRAERSEGEVIVSVKDAGIGIAPEKLDVIFEMFTQLNPAPSTPHSGLGIGLTLVRQLVVMHGGSIEARSAGEGEGSEFVVRLPALDEPVAARSPLGPAHEKSTS